MCEAQNKMFKTYPISFGLNMARLPLIVVDVEGNKLCFLLDTGSTHNLIESNVASYFSSIIEKKGEQVLLGIEGNKMLTEIVSMPFKFEGKSFLASFCSKPLLDSFSSIEAESGIQIHGIIGTEFMMENQWIIDFELNVVHFY